MANWQFKNINFNYYFSLGLTHGKFWGKWYVVPFKTVPTIIHENTSRYGIR